MRIEASNARITIAPINRPRPVRETAWIEIADVGIEDWAEWSPDVEKLYSTSNRDLHSRAPPDNTDLQALTARLY